MNDLTQEECSACLAEARAYVVELQESGVASAEEMREARHEVVRWQHAYYAAMVDCDDEDEGGAAK